MDDLFSGFATLQERVVSIASGLDDEGLSLPVPACPAWSVRDVVAHLTGTLKAHPLTSSMPAVDVWSPDPVVAADAKAVIDRWTDEMVSSRRSLGVAEVLAEWQDHAGRLFAMHAGDIPSDGIDVEADFFVVYHDLAVHWVDLCGATDTTFDTSDPLLAMAARLHAQSWLPVRLNRHGLEGLALDVTDLGESWGDQNAVMCVGGTAFELGRALAGRRSAAQVRGLDWSSESEAYRAAFITGAYPGDDLYP